MKKLVSIAALTAAAAILVGCGKSENITKLEDLLAKAEAEVEACNSKESTEAMLCKGKVLSDLGTEWSAAVPAAANDDPETLAELTNRYSNFSQKVSASI